MHGPGSRQPLLGRAPELLGETGGCAGQGPGALHVSPQPGRPLPHRQEVSRQDFLAKHDVASICLLLSLNIDIHVDFI